uniref:Putative secreted protein n=1 Tax=Anopheles marajoara TaxID=58244 RepID=A0A2M4CBC3_9DIPT
MMLLLLLLLLSSVDAFLTGSPLPGTSPYQPHKVTQCSSTANRWGGNKWHNKSPQEVPRTGHVPQQLMAGRRLAAHIFPAES